MTAGFQVILIPVPVEPLKNSPPFGERMAELETEGSVESMINETVPVAVFQSLSIATIRASALAVSTDGIVQEVLPLFAPRETSEVHVEPELVE